jgi:hypothetical protein
MKMKKVMSVLTVAVFLIAGNVFAYDINQVKIQGFISQGWLKSDSNNYYFADTEDGTFEFNEFGLNVMSELSDKLKIGIQLLSKDLGQFGNNEVGIDWAYGDYRFRNWLGIRAGKIKMAKGLYNHIRDVDAARSCIFLPHSVYNEAYRDTTVALTGISLYGIFPAGFEYEAQFGKMEIPSDGAVAATLADGLGIAIDDMNTEVSDDTANFHLQWSPSQISGLRITGSYLANLKWDVMTPKMTLTYDVMSYIAGIEYARNNLTLAAEYGRIMSESTAGNTLSDNPTKELYYGMTSYRFNDLFEAGTYYSVLYNDVDDRDGEMQEQKGLPKESAWLKDLAVFARFDIQPNWIVKLEGHYIDGLVEILDVTSADLSDEGFLFAVKTTFTF